MTIESKNNLAIIFGSDTQMTEDIAERIALKLNVENISFKDVCSIKSSEILNYNPIIFGVPTWYVGELQSDWDVFFPEFEINEKVTHTRVAFLFPKLFKIYPKAVRTRTNKGSLIGQVILKIT